MPFMTVDDERLLWLENEGLQYLRDWKKHASRPENFLTNETCEAFEFTTKLTVPFNDIYMADPDFYVYSVYVTYKSHTNITIL